MWCSVLFEYFVLQITTYVLRNNAVFCGTEVKDLDICIVFSPYARSKMKSGTLTLFVNQKRLPGGPNAYCRRENPANVI